MRAESIHRVGNGWEVVRAGNESALKLQLLDDDARTSLSDPARRPRLVVDAGWGQFATALPRAVVHREFADVRSSGARGNAWIRNSSARKSEARSYCTCAPDEQSTRSSSRVDAEESDRAKRRPPELMLRKREGHPDELEVGTGALAEKRQTVGRDVERHARRMKRNGMSGGTLGVEFTAFTQALPQRVGAAGRISVVEKANRA